MTIKQAIKITGGLSSTSKMPCYSYSLPAEACKTGTKLRKIEGSICSKCYAYKGNYRYKQVEKALKRRLRAIKNPEWVAAMTILIKNSGKYFRWHDSGDIQNIEHLDKIIKVCYNTPKTKHWLPTKESSILLKYINDGGSIPKNLIIRISDYMIDNKNTVWKIFNHKRILSCGTSKIKYNCPAHKQEGKCLACRKCWDTGYKRIIYKYH